MYETVPPAGYSAESARLAYADFLADIPRFYFALGRVLLRWPISCEQFLSNPNINRIAWLGQASMCIETGVPACFRAGFSIMSPDQQRTANEIAKQFLDHWERSYVHR